MKGEKGNIAWFFSSVINRPSLAHAAQHAHMKTTTTERIYRTAEETSETEAERRRTDNPPTPRAASPMMNESGLLLALLATTGLGGILVLVLLVLVLVLVLLLLLFLLGRLLLRVDRSLALDLVGTNLRGAALVR